MTHEHDSLSQFRDDFLDYLEGYRDNPPAVEDLRDEQRAAAEAFIKSIIAARGVDPHASRPSVEQLLARGSRAYDRTGELGEVLQRHLRARVDPKASVIPDAASTAVGLASTSVVLARGMRIRVVPETESADLDYALTERAEDIARVFGAFPDSHAVLYTTTGIERLGVMVDRGDVHRAIETPSGARRAPRLRRSISDAATACEMWFKDMIPNFEPLSIDLLEPSGSPESALNPYRLANQVVNAVSTSGARARIEAKRATWSDFGDREAQYLAAIVQEAQLGQMSEESYESHLNDLVGIAA